MAVVSLLTDFGARDPYVAAMKGVIASRCSAAIIDLTHEIAPFDVFEAGWFLRSVAPQFTGERETARPAVFVAVVDPGVGSGRRILLAERGHHRYLAPDNGLLSLLPRRIERMYSVENRAFFLPGESTTFHGRDRFAPVAAALASGTPAAEFGPAIDPGSIEKLPYEPPSYDTSPVIGTVVSVDRFGNLITDIEAGRLPAVGHVVLGRHTVTRGATHYAEVVDGPFFLTGSAGTLEVSLPRGSAAEMLQIARFERVEVHVGS
jgi:S-adenosyl-L-methionine hydrolase (adenosine-forming)